MFNIASATTLFDSVAKEHRPPSLPALIPAAPDINAKGYVLMDAQSSTIVAQKNADERMAPASLTKMMTMYIVEEALHSGQIHLDDEVTISKDAWAMGGSKMFVRQGQKVKVNDLIQGVIVDSGNDACVALAEYVAGSEKAFAGLMNHEAQRLGMTGSHFVDSTGMPNRDHYTTPKDMGILAQALIRDFPEYYPWYKQKWFTFNGIKQPNRNRLLWRYQYADGIKTGHTKAAGYCLVSSALKDNMRLVSVVMGTPSDSARAKDSQALLMYGFRFYKTYKVYSAGDTVVSPRIWSGNEKTIPVGLTADLYLTIPNGQYDHLQAVTSLHNPIKAPVEKGKQLGELNISLAGKELAKRPLVALRDDPKGGMWTRFTDSISLSLHKPHDDQTQSQHG